MGKKSSVFQIVVISVFAALAVGGVLVFALLMNNNAASSTGPVVIWGPFDDRTFGQVIQDLSDADPTFKQVTYVRKDVADYEDTLTQALAAGQGPDLFFLRQDYVMKDAPKTNPIPETSLSATQFQTAFIDAANVFYGRSGAVALPLLADPMILFWNRDLLSAAGYAQPPRFWDEISGMARAITGCQATALTTQQSTIVGCDHDTLAIKKATVALGAYDNVIHAKDVISTIIMQEGGAVTARDESGDLGSGFTSYAGGPAQAIEKAVGLYSQFSDPSREDYTWNTGLPDSRSAFTSGDLALYVGFGNELGLIRRANPNLNLAVANMPQVRESGKTLTGAHVYGLAVSRTGKNPQGALTVAFALGGAATSKQLADALGLVSARRDVLSAAGRDEAGFLSNAAIASRTWIDPNPDKTDAAFRAMIGAIVSGTMRQTEAIERADQEIKNAIGI